MYYVALRRGQEVIYTYTPREPKVNDSFYYMGKSWIVAGYIPCEYFK